MQTANLIRPLKIGTRGSALALAQAHETRDRLSKAHGLPEGAFEIVVISTAGDRILDRPLSEAGGKGLFTKEIEEALLDGTIDIAVHSSKDMPTKLPEGLMICAFLPREDVHDAFIGRSVKNLADLPPGATIGSSSLRRQAQIRKLRPDLNVVMFRGNVQTRLRKLEEGQVDGTLLAHAGLRRLGLAHIITEVLDMERFLPAPGQGAICIECRESDEGVRHMLDAIADKATEAALLCERSFLAALDGDCKTPIAANATANADTLVLTGMILTPDGTQSHLVEDRGPIGEAAKIGKRAGAVIRAKAGPEFFESWV